MAVIRCARPVAILAIVVVIALLPVSASAAARPGDRGEVLGRATRSTAPTSPAAVAAVPTGFTDSAVWSGLTLPTAIAFGPGGKVFVGEKGGIVKVFDSIADPTPTQVVDLRARVQDFWDRGLLGLAVDPGFGTAGRNFVYVLYTHDLNPVGNPASWGDGCPTPPGPTTDGCTVTGNLSRIPVDPATGAASGPEQPLITDGWCQQYPSHSIGHLAFGPDGNLYVTGGDGASFTNTDWGQFGGGAGSPTPANPCGDPPGSVGTPLSPPGAEGGALRSQSPRRVAGHPILLDGAVLRVDPATGSGVAGNPMFDPQNASSNASRIIGYGLRNPFRFTFRPGTSELWVGDVGWNTWEEVNRMTSPTPANPVNFGWPCYEGAGRMSSYDSANLTICENLYADTVRPATTPYYAYNHSASVVSGDGCPTNQGSVISAISFYPGGSYPGTYNGALFFGDHSRNCIWAMLPGGNGLPSASNLRAFVVDPNSHPVDLAADPASGDLFYANFEGGQIRRIQYIGRQQPTPGRGHRQPDQRPGATHRAVHRQRVLRPRRRPDHLLMGPQRRRHLRRLDRGQPELHLHDRRDPQVTLRVTDARGASSVSAPITITVGAGNTPPTPVIDTPALQPHLGGGRHHQLLRPRHRRPGRHPAGLRAVLAGHHPPLHHRLPHPPGGDLVRRRLGIVRGPGPRLPVVPGDPAHRDRLRRHDRHHEREPPAQDGEPHLPVQPLRAAAHRRPDDGQGPVHHHRDRERGRSSDRPRPEVPREELRLRVLVRRRRPGRTPSGFRRRPPPIPRPIGG